MWCLSFGFFTMPPTLFANAARLANILGGCRLKLYQSCVRRFSVKLPLSESLPSHEIAPRPKRLVVAITGATGISIGVRVLQMLKQCQVETHLVMSKWGLATMKYETDYTMDDIMGLASHIYTAKDVSAPISSGSFHHDGMIVVPCSMKTLAGIRMGYTEDLIVRAADVTLKERRKLLLVTRETPLSDIHLENVLFLSRMGAYIFPPVPAFYTRPQTVDDIIEQSSGRILDCFGIDTNSFPRWEGIKNTKTHKNRV